MNWRHSRVLVTGGASFIGSALVDALVERGAQVRVVDNLSSGKTESLAEALKHGAVEFHEADLFGDGVARSAVGGMDVVFHLAADHGGRGHRGPPHAPPAAKFSLHRPGFSARGEEKNGKNLFAPSRGGYPNYIQTD